MLLLSRKMHFEQSKRGKKSIALFLGCGTGCFHLHLKNTTFKSEWFTCFSSLCSHTWRGSTGWRRLSCRSWWTSPCKCTSTSCSPIRIRSAKVGLAIEATIQGIPTLFVCSRPIQGLPACWGPCDCNAIPRNSCNGVTVKYSQCKNQFSLDDEVHVEVLRMQTLVLITLSSSST